MASTTIKLLVVCFGGDIHAWTVTAIVQLILALSWMSEKCCNLYRTAESEIVLLKLSYLFLKYKMYYFNDKVMVTYIFCIFLKRGAYTVCDL